MARQRTGRASHALMAATAIAAAALLAQPLPPPSATRSSPLPAGRATLVFTGDVMLGRGVGQLVRDHGADWPWAEVKGLFQADWVIANLESPLADLPGDASPAINLSAGAASADTLAAAGVRTLSLANNHALDAGPNGLAATLVELQKRSISAVGAGQTAAEARAPNFRSVNGVRVALLAYTDVPQSTEVVPQIEPTVAGLDPDTMKAEVARAKEKADVVAVIFHWGEEYAVSPTPRQREIARKAARAGADLVIGSHPHVVQPVEFLQGSVVAYSLGNFLFDQQWSAGTTQGQALRVHVNLRGIEQVEIIPISLASGRPTTDGQVEMGPNANVAFHWNGAGFEPLPTRVFYNRPHLEADLDGDGAMERVVLEGDPNERLDQPAVAVTVWRWSGWGFYLDWRSPPGRYRNLRLVDIVGSPESRGVDILLKNE